MGLASLLWVKENLSQKWEKQPTRKRRGEENETEVITDSWNQTSLLMKWKNHPENNHQNVWYSNLQQYLLIYYPTCVCCSEGTSSTRAGSFFLPGLICAPFSPESPVQCWTLVAAEGNWNRQWTGTQTFELWNNKSSCSCNKHTSLSRILFQSRLVAADVWFGSHIKC